MTNTGLIALVFAAVVTTAAGSSHMAKSCSTKETDKQMYTCANLPMCCSDHVGAGIAADKVQCVDAGPAEAMAKKYKVVCPAKCSTKETDKQMYTCAKMPTCCSDHVGAGIAADKVQCVDAGPAKAMAKSYKVVCPAMAKSCVCTTKATTTCKPCNKIGSTSGAFDRKAPLLLAIIGSGAAAFAQ